MRFMRTRLGQSVLAAAIGASFLLGGVANAAGLIPGPDGIIHGCYTRDGRLRVISVGQACERNETALPWNQQGPKGDMGEPGPAGPSGLAHVVVRSASDTVASGAAASATAQCQPGETATGGGAQISNAGSGGNGGLGGNGGAGGNGAILNTGFGNTGLGNAGFANSGTAGAGGGGAAYLTGSAPNAAQGPATGWTGTVTNLSGADQTVTVWAMCAS